MAQQRQSHSIPQTGNPGITRYIKNSPENGPQPQPKPNKALPELYTNVPPVSLPANAAPTITDDQVIPSSADMDEDQMQIPWFDKVTTALANVNTLTRYGQALNESNRSRFVSIQARYHN